MDIQTLKDISPLIVAIGLLLTIWTLRANHDWNRRQFACKMIEDWNPRTSEHRKAIEKLKPGIIDVNGRNAIVSLSAEEMEKIYDATPESQEFALRFHFIELLNYFEYISAAYWNQVADQHMIEASFRNTMLNWHKVLENFIVVFEKKRGQKEPWGPYHDLIRHWNSVPPRKFRNSTANFISWVFGIGK